MAFVEFGWTPGVGDGQGGLACCSSWGLKESDTTEWLNWTELLYLNTLNNEINHCFSSDIINIVIMKTIPFELSAWWCTNAYTPSSKFSIRHLMYIMSDIILVSISPWWKAKVNNYLDKVMLTQYAMLGPLTPVWTLWLQLCIYSCKKKIYPERRLVNTEYSRS